MKRAIVLAVVVGVATPLVACGSSDGRTVVTPDPETAQEPPANPNAPSPNPNQPAPATTTDPAPNPNTPPPNPNQPALPSSGTSSPSSRPVDCHTLCVPLEGCATACADRCDAFGAQAQPCADEVAAVLSCVARAGLVCRNGDVETRGASCDPLEQALSDCINPVDRPNGGN